MIIGIDHEYGNQEFIDFDYKKIKIVSHDWIKLEHLDRRKGFLTLFNYDPFTGERIYLSQIKRLIKFDQEITSSNEH